MRHASGRSSFRKTHGHLQTGSYSYVVRGEILFFVSVSICTDEDACVFNCIYTNLAMLANQHF